MKHKIYILLLFMGSTSITAQTLQERKSITKDYGLQKLELFQQKIKKIEEQRENLVREASRKNLWPIKVYENGKLKKIAIDVTKTGKPIYMGNHNVRAAESTRTDYLQPGGLIMGKSLNLTGKDLVIGLWEVGGIPLINHVEFTTSPSDTTSRAIDKESSSTDSYHATHVCGTLIARGANPDAKGMAPAATVYAYNNYNDISEVVSEAANGLLLSNHSYGIYLYEDDGSLQVSNIVPGKYIQFSQAWDYIHYNAPKYLQVVSAGNEGYQGYTGSLATNRDKLIGNKVCKNNLVVANAQDAAINSQGSLLTVTINSSSSQGPTDDRRIKPDIAGNGTGLYSSLNNSPTSYGFATGTSMSAPNVAGTLLLLQEYYKDVNATFMRSATLKGLACHTADDAGDPGPDEVFGWGLLNAKKAAETIMGNIAANDTDKEAIIEELTLNQGGSYSITVLASGLEDLKASITWTDPAGSLADDQLNSSTPVLVNDLDIRVTQGSDTFLPWKLDFSAPAGNAIKGDNTVDNVERVDVENPSGSYTITVTHKGILTNGSQAYSLIITGLQGDTSAVDEFDSSSISIWPNPANNTVNFSHAAGFSETNIVIYDMNGRMVKSYEVNNTNRFAADISNLEPGIYIAEMTDGKNVYREKIIKK